MSIAVTGATGQLGRHVVASLLTRGVPASSIVAVGRAVERLSDLADLGVRVARIDYDDPQSLQDAFKGADRVLIVSGTDFGRRVSQHTIAAQAAIDAGVTSLAYTSMLRADTTALLLAAEHRGTEESLATLGLPVSCSATATTTRTTPRRSPGTWRTASPAAGATA